MGGHQHEVGIELSRTLMEVARGDAGDIALLGGDVDELGVDLQLLVPEDDVDARVLHLLAPADIGLLVEAGEQLDDRGDALAIERSGGERTDDLGVVRYAVKRDAYLGDKGIDRRLLQQPQDVVEALIGEVDAEVTLQDTLDEALSVAACRGAQRGLRGKAQLATAEVGQRHQVAHVVVASASDACVSEVELRHIA